MMIKLDAIEGLIDEVAKLKKGNELLEELWLEHGPYRDDPISDELWYKVNNFFEFDDSE